MTALLSIRDLSVTYSRDGRDVAALKGVNLEIAAGERLAVIGESGSGKSTLALAVAGLLPASARVNGSIEWRQPQSQPAPSFPASSVLPDFSPARAEIGSFVAGRDFGFVFQDPSASLDPVMAVGKQVAEIVRAHADVEWAEAFRKAKTLLERVQLPDPDSALRAFPHQLSGGQKQRVAIAAAIAAGPRLLIADEATSALDTIVQADIVALIRRLVTEDDMALMFISHDIALATQLADRVAVFRHGEMVELGETARIVGAPTHPYTRMLLDAHIGLAAEPLLQRSGHSA